MRRGHRCRGRRRRRATRPRRSDGGRTGWPQPGLLPQRRAAGRSYKLGHRVGAVLPPVITRALRPVTTGASGAGAPIACSGEIVNRAGRCAGPGSWRDADRGGSAGERRPRCRLSGQLAGPVQASVSRHRMPLFPGILGAWMPGQEHVRQWLVQLAAGPAGVGSPGVTLEERRGRSTRYTRPGPRLRHQRSCTTGSVPGRLWQSGAAARMGRPGARSGARLNRS
jgi:hypothetical protein